MMWAAAGATAAGLAVAGAFAVHGAGEGRSVTLSAEGAAASSARIVCPDVAGRLPAIPASAQAEVDRNLAQLHTQIDEANRRLSTSAGEGGPNFVQNAILGPLTGKRTAAIERITIAIGRTTTPPTGLETLATCQLSNAAGGGTGAGNAAGGNPAGGNAGGGKAAGGKAGSGAQNGANQNGGNAGGGATAAPPGNAQHGGGAATGRIVCPDVAGRLPAIPASAQAEVDRNLAQLHTQIDEANRRLSTSAGEGGPNFVQNAILGPLTGKRTAAIERITIAIGRTTTPPTGLETLATCQLGK